MRMIYNYKKYSSVYGKIKTVDEVFNILTKFASIIDTLGIQQNSVYINLKDLIFLRLDGIAGINGIDILSKTHVCLDEFLRVLKICRESDPDADLVIETYKGDKFVVTGINAESNITNLGNQNEMPQVTISLY